MSLLGKAALAMWWDIASAVKADFEDWHSHEHFPERLGIPGFRRGSRWRSATGGEGVFVMYELEAYDTLLSPHYLARLNAPTPWSTRMMPHHRNMVRSQCLVLESNGGGVAANALTVRLSPAGPRGDDLRASLKSLAGMLAMKPGLVGAHLLMHRTPAIERTTEQKIRGADQVADWVFIACGYDVATLDDLAKSELSAEHLAERGAAPGAVGAVYALAYSATPGDVS